QGHYPETVEGSLTTIFQKTVEKANEFLLETPKKEGFNLGGNLSFSALALGGDLSLVATRLTSVKMFLLRDGQITALGDNFPPTTNNLFANTLEGQTKENDKIIIFNKELAGIFEIEKVLSLVAGLNTLKDIKKLIKKKQKALKEAVGSCLIILVKKESYHQLPQIKLSDNNPLFKLFQKILPQSPTLKLIVLKIIISLAVLAILLPLGYFLFHR
ncbi:MAG: hypothetical protein NTV62_00860, partial [Candidatus Gribaldobacteria bacterium]|nr:hypothetical protein [Candidatus Gribaldobacteria bacterium]